VCAQSRFTNFAFTQFLSDTLYSWVALPDVSQPTSTAQRRPVRRASVATLRYILEACTVQMACSRRKRTPVFAAALLLLVCTSLHGTLLAPQDEVVLKNTRKNVVLEHPPLAKRVGDGHRPFPNRTPPVVWTAIDFKLFGAGSASRYTVGVVCACNARLVVLSTIEQQVPAPYAHCVEVHRIPAPTASVDSTPLFAGLTRKGRIFFLRWWALARWMRQTNTPRVLATDSDVLWAGDVREFERVFAKELSAADLWAVVLPPRASLQLALLDVDMLEDMLVFFTVLLRPEVWGDAPLNDMVAFGAYAHAGTAEPWPCWGLEAGTADAFCRGSNYANSARVARVVAAFGRRPLFSVGSIGPSPAGGRLSGFPALGAAENNPRYDPMAHYLHEQGAAPKGSPPLLRFVNGWPEMATVNGWRRRWAYALEDGDEAHAKHHAKWILRNASCECASWRCDVCEPH